MPRKRKTAREQNQDLIEVKISLGKDMIGKRIQKSFYGRTKGEAREKADEYRAQYAKGEAVNKSVSFVEWAETWLKTYKEQNVKSSTYRYRYISFIETHLKPYFKQVKIANITQIDIQNFINSKAELNKDTQKRYISMLKAIFESAIENNIIYKNPVKKIATKSENIKRKKQVYNKLEVDKIIEFAKTHKYGAAIIVFLKTGLRRGELLALQWCDIDFERNIISVQRAVADIPHNGKLTPIVEENSNETKNHNRKIPFGNTVRKALLNIDKTSEFVFPNNKGKVNSPNNYSRRHYAMFMKDLCSEYPEIKKLTPHELRHTYGTLLYESGVDLRVIQKVMGHADLKITSEIYIHDNIDYMKAELEKIN